MTSFAATDRTRLRRKSERGAFDRATVYAILDEGMICHVGFVHEGSPVVIPTAYGRDGDRLYIHGSSASRTIRTLATGVDLCLAVTLLDGLILARSGFHNSVNYRSVVVFGRATVVEGTEGKLAAMEKLTDHLVPGRWADSRPPTAQELKAMSVLEIPIEEASAKVRPGGPVDEPEDYRLPIWAGNMPLAVAAGAPFDDGKLLPGVEVPEYVRGWRREGIRDEGWGLGTMNAWAHPGSGRRLNCLWRGRQAPDVRGGSSLLCTQRRLRGPEQR
jgi:hypothetical protein